MTYKVAHSGFDKSSIYRVNYIASVMMLRWSNDDDNMQSKVFHQNKETITEGYQRQLLAVSESIIKSGIKDFNKLKRDFYSVYRDKKPVYKSLASTPVGSKKDFFGEYQNRSELQKIRYVNNELNQMIRILAESNVSTNESDIFQENIYRNINLIETGTKRVGKNTTVTSKLKEPKDIYENILMRAEQLKNISYTPDIKVGNSNKRTLKDWGYNVSNMRLNNLFNAFEQNRNNYPRSYDYIKHMTNEDILRAWADNPDEFKLVFDYKEGLTDNDSDLLDILISYDKNKLSKERRGDNLYE